MYIIDEIKNTLLVWEEEALQRGLNKNDYSQQFCKEEYDRVLEELNKINSFNDLIYYFMTSLPQSYKESITTINNLMKNTKSLMN